MQDDRWIPEWLDPNNTLSRLDIVLDTISLGVLRLGCILV